MVSRHPAILQTHFKFNFLLEDLEAIYVVSLGHGTFSLYPEHVQTGAPMAVSLGTAGLFPSHLYTDGIVSGTGCLHGPPVSLPILEDPILYLLPFSSVCT